MFFYKIDVQKNVTTRYCIKIFRHHNQTDHRSVIMHIYMYIYNTYICILFFNIIGCFYVENLI
jgi:hypothetical protein